MSNPCDTGWCRPDECTDAICREDQIPEIEVTDDMLQKNADNFVAQEMKKKYQIR